jgi:hypothetical protein
LHKKGFPIQYAAEEEKIVDLAQVYLKKTEGRQGDAVRLLQTLESPVGLTVEYLEKCLDAEK